jgi:hypothetical protein
MDYSKGKIYKIIDLTNGDVYIGSTIQGNLTRPCHKCHDFYIGRNYDNCKIIVMETFNYITYEEVLWKEREWIDKTDCINKNRPIITEEERKEMKLNNAIKWNDANNERINELRKNRYHFKNSWGGDPRRDNNLLKINPDLFR